MILQQEEIEKPGNDLRFLFLNYIDFITAFISEEKTNFEILKKNSSGYLEKIKKNESNEQSPFHLFVQSEILLQQAIVRIKFGENILSANEIRKAYKLIHINESKFPEFILNKKISGLLNVILGSVPARYNWIINYAGMEGNITKGVDELQFFYKESLNKKFDCYRPEILFYLGYINSVFSSPVDKVNLYNQMKPLIDKMPFIAYIYSNNMMKQGKNDEAINALNKSISFFLTRLEEC